MRSALACLLLVALLCPGVVSKDPKTTVLNEWPMVMAHDAATTYLEGGLLHQINDWTKTQADGGPSGMLNCGARGFDWRPLLKSDGSVVMHHGDIEVDHSMQDALTDMTKWCASHTAVEDLVLISIVDCSGDPVKGVSCTQATKTLLSSLGISYIDNCSELEGLTVQAASKRASLKGGGSLLAVFDCKADHYDPSVACSGYGNAAVGFDTPAAKSLYADQAAASRAHLARAAVNESSFYTCYSDSSTKAFPLDRMWKYVNDTVHSGPSGGNLYTLQTLWQESVASIAIGELHGSTLLDDESRSNLNALVTSKIKSGSINVSRINFVEVNNVCDGGAELAAALKTATS